MRWLSVSILIILLASASLFTFARYRKTLLKEYCAKLPKYVELSKVREEALGLDFHVELEAHIQMKISPSRWYFFPPTCRVFFNPERTLEYRVWQD